MTEISGQFSEQIKPLLKPEDAQRGYLLAVGRDGKRDYFPVVSATVVGIASDEHSFATQYELTQELAKRKKDAKKAKRDAFWAQVFQ